MKTIFITFFLLIFNSITANAWGFWAHQKINRLAVFCLPPEMIFFYKTHITYISEQAVRPDQRRYAVKEEAPRHYIDIDVYKEYGDSAVYLMPRYWKQAVEKHTEDSLQAYGIVPWHIQKMKYRLTQAFQHKDVDQILRLSAEIGHYIADANVPLHTTENYNGQLTGQKGIHGLWESRLPELFAEKYDFFVGMAEYQPEPQLTAWKAVTAAHLALDSVLTFEKELSARFPQDQKYAMDEKGNLSTKMYAYEYARAYHKMLDGQVERRMRASVKMVADFWYTCWVDAGMPELRTLNTEFPELQKKQIDIDSTECVR